MTCYIDQVGNYVCPPPASQDPIAATWSDLTAWTSASPLHLAFFFVSCAVVGMFFQRRRNEARRVVIVDPAPAGAAKRLMDDLYPDDVAKANANRERARAGKNGFVVPPSMRAKPTRPAPVADPSKGPYR